MLGFTLHGAILQLTTHSRKDNLYQLKIIINYAE